MERLMSLFKTDEENKEPKASRGSDWNPPPKEEREKKNTWEKAGWKGRGKGKKRIFVFPHGRANNKLIISPLFYFFFFADCSAHYKFPPPPPRLVWMPYHWPAEKLQHTRFLFFHLCTRWQTTIIIFFFSCATHPHNAKKMSCKPTFISLGEQNPTNVPPPPPPFFSADE